MATTPKFLDADGQRNTRARRIHAVRALVVFYGLTMDEVAAAFTEVQQQAAVGKRPCPACPDGYRWTHEGPTADTCTTCGGEAWVPLRSNER